MARAVKDRVAVRVPASRHFRVPWRIIIIGFLLIVLLFVLAVVAREIASRATSGDAPAPAAQAGEQQVVVPANPQVPQNAQENTNTAVLQSWPKVEVRWVSIGRTGRGHTKTVLDLQIPKRAPDNMGDGVAAIGKDPADGRYWFTPDKGVHKYKLANIPPANFNAGFGPASGRLEEDVGTQGAFIVGEAVVLFMYTQVEPWVFENWRAEIPLSELEGLR